MKFAKTALATLVAVTSVLSSASAIADMSNGLIKSKSIYGAVDLGTVTPLASYLSSPTMVRVAVGADLAALPAVSIEANIAMFSDSTADFPGTGLSETITRSSFGASGIYTLPLQNGFSVFGKAGLNYTMAKDTIGGTVMADNNKVLLAYGIGAKYDVNSKYAVRAMWEDLGDVSGNGFSTSQTALSIGGVMRF